MGIHDQLLLTFLKPSAAWQAVLGLHQTMDALLICSEQLDVWEVSVGL